MLSSRSVGDLTTDTDDVLVDGRLIPAANYNTASRCGQAIADRQRG